MRRPSSFCCDQHGGGGGGNNHCQTQEAGESTLARVRRFLSVSMGGRSSSRPPTTHCKHHTLPPDPLHAPHAHAVHSLLEEMKEAGVGVQGVLGKPLEEVIAEGGEDSSGHGVPPLVHLLCCYLLTHGVDYDTLVSEDWCAEEVRTRLLLERGAAGLPAETQEPPPGSDAAIATGLLRLFLDELPHSLIPSSAAAQILQLVADRGPVAVAESGGLCEEALGVAIVPRLRRLLHRHLPLHCLCLLRYLTAFIHQLRTSNHNTCPVPVAALGRVLARVMVSPSSSGGDDDDDEEEEEERRRRRGGERRGEKKRAPSPLDVPHLANRLGEILIVCYNDIFQSGEDDPDDLSDSVSSPSSIGEGMADNDEDDDDDEDGTTTTDTDDFRSPPVSPQKTMTSASMTSRARGGALGAGGMRPPPLSLRDTTPTSRSNREVDHLDSIRPKVTPYTKELLVNPPVGSLMSPSSPEDQYSQDDEDDVTSQSPESSCVSAQDYWETGGESERGEEEEEEEEEEEVAVVGGDLKDSHEERRLNERSFYRSFSQSSRRPRRRTKKRHHSHSPKESSLRSQSSEDDTSSSYLRSLTSEDEEPTRYDPVPSDVMTCQPPSSNRPSSPVTVRLEREPSLGLSELLNAGEPVPSDRGSWGMRESCDTWHRTAPRYSRFDDETPMQSAWYRSDDDDLILSPRASESYKDAVPPPGSDNFKTPPPGQSAVKILMKNINSIKKKIKRYEEEFESAFGYRPSHSEKMKHKEIKKYMSELSKARKELKQMKDDVAGMMSVPTVFPLSLLRCQEATNPNAPTPAPTPKSGTADTIRQVEDRLREKRSASGRPLDLGNMNKTEMQEEKTALQKALLYYESVHGRPTTKEDRDLARPLYDRYRQVKRIVMRTNSRAKENMVELAPILEHEAMDFTLASPQHRGSLQGEEVEKISLPPSPPTTPPVFDTPIYEAPLTPAPITTMTTTTTPCDDGRRSAHLGDLHALPLSELRERKKEARDEKKKLRRALREFEENFERDMGRKVQKEERGPMEQTYLDYKHAKAKLRLLEALLSKHEPHKV